MEAASVPLREACDVGYGLRTGDNARHVERRAPSAGEVGLAGGADVVPYALRWLPKTLLQSDSFRHLVARQLGRARVAIQRIRTNSTAPWARWLEAAPVPAEVVCLDSLSTLSCDDPDRLWALLALVQSVALNRVHRLRTTDVNVKPAALRELPVPRGLLSGPGELAGLARRRAAMSDPRGKLFTGGGRGPPIEEPAAREEAHALDRRIDALVYDLFGLSADLVEAAERGFWGDRFPQEIRQLEAAMSDPLASLVRKEGTA
jgi:hypothetical protein